MTQSLRSKHLWAGLFLANITLLTLGTVYAVHATEPDKNALLTLGHRLYQEGITVSGTPVQAISQEDIHISGAQAACAKCHRASGFGSSEGGYYVPPITGPILFSPRQLERTRLFPELFQQVQPPGFYARLHQPHMRPAYTLESLSLALRQGKDSEGQDLAAIMPHYELTDKDVAALSAYLSHLSSQIDPGTNDHEIRFATVFSEDVPAGDREAVLRTMQAYIAWNNQNLRQDRARSNFSPYHRSDFVPLERLWSLSVWTVTGPKDTWRQQIEEYHRHTPVFAVIGGMVQESWAPIAAFCDDQKIPCLFPNTDLPVIEAQGQYTMYFSEGLTLEAKVLAHFLATMNPPPQRIIQLSAKDAFGSTPSKTLEDSLRTLRPDFQLETIKFLDHSELSALFADQTFQPSDKDVLIVWPGADAQTTIDQIVQTQSNSNMIILPSRAILPVSSSSARTADNLFFIEPHEISVASHPRSFIVRAWMRTRGIEIDRPLLQFQTFYALSLVDAALGNIREDFYRDYLIERIERESEKDLNPGIYPRLALGPMQRFASKGAYIVRLDPEHPGNFLAISDWIVP
jgi:cytochrome c553